MVSFFQILEVIDRVDLKAELLQELDRQKTVMSSLLDNPKIDVAILQPVLEKILLAAAKLRTIQTRIGQPLKENEWLMSIKQRAIIPGGLCEFDMPAYHYWLEGSALQRQSDLKNWLDHIMPLYDALSIILSIVRGSGSPVQHTALQGSFQQMLGGAKPAQMLKISLDDNMQCYPEISANKYAINVRFICMQGSKPEPSHEDISFTLTLGNL